MEIFRFKNMSLIKRTMVQFTGALAIAGVLFYYAKRDIMTKRKAELDEYRINRNRETPGSENTKS